MTDTNTKVREHYNSPTASKRHSQRPRPKVRRSLSLSSHHSISSTPEAFSRLASWLTLPGSINPLVCWILAAASEGRRAILPRLSAAR